MKMSKSYRSITLCYRKIISATSAQGWEKMLLEDTYKEFKMQFQLYNQQQQYFTFSHLLQVVPGAQQLHFLVSAAATGYVQQLGDKMPDIKDNLGLSFMKFQHFRFEIIQSDIRNISAHTVALNFISEPFLWTDTIGNCILLAKPVLINEPHIQTHMLPLQPFLSIHSILNTEA